MSIFICYKFFFLFFPLLVVGLDDCTTTRCSKGGPTIRFPFRNKFLQPEHCGYPGFDLYCDKSKTVLELPFSVKVEVKKIDYASQEIHLHGLDGCLPQKLLYLNLSASPFQFLEDDRLSNYVMFNCTAVERKIYNNIPCLGVPGYQVYCIPSYSHSDDYDLTSCIKIREISSVLWYTLDQHDLHLKWSEPYCGKCEAQGNICSLDTNKSRTQCTNKPKTHRSEQRGDLINAGATLGAFLSVGSLVVFYYVYSSSRMKKKNRATIEKFLEDYRALKPTRFSYAEIRNITNQIQNEEKSVAKQGKKFTWGTEALLTATKKTT
ncbi:unnamed protein product [Fraxinus pennsylvanica]|uniref:RING-type E3 ubiquitin transferase n=1 Tax=Fraxinus pennsylvanica TaxID=56036 RepID=A0AAD2DPR0_9LAMI|nr:unnamed protein product [Fraxinus pennsylvanica]